jgi:hypothetical protein
VSTSSVASSVAAAVTAAVASTVSTTATVSTTLTPTLAVAVSGALVVAPLMSCAGSVTEPLPDSDHLAALILVGAQIAVAPHFHRLDLSGLSSRSLHDPGADLVADTDAVAALASLTQPQPHLLALASSDHEVIEFIPVLGLLLLLDLDDFSSHFLGIRPSRSGESGVKGCKDYQGRGLRCLFHGVVPPHSNSGSGFWFLLHAHQWRGKAESVPIPVSPVTIDFSGTCERGLEYPTHPSLDNRVESERLLRRILPAGCGIRAGSLPARAVSFVGLLQRACEFRHKLL